MSEKALVSESITKMYEELDKHAEIITTKLRTTCTKGCDSCCYLLATISFAEGVAVAEKLLQKPDWFSLVPKLKAAAEAHCFDGISKATYLAKKLPCVFLDTEKHACTIYEFRPATCRYHYVVSPPENCNPDHPVGRTGIIDLSPLMNTVWSLTFEVMRQLGLGPDDAVAPIPMMVLWCMLRACGEGKGRRLLLEATRYLPTPGEFLERYHAGLLEDADAEAAEKVLLTDKEGIEALRRGDDLRRKTD